MTKFLVWLGESLSFFGNSWNSSRGEEALFAMPVGESCSFGLSLLYIAFAFYLTCIVANSWIIIGYDKITPLHKTLVILANIVCLFIAGMVVSVIFLDISSTLGISYFIVFFAFCSVVTLARLDAEDADGGSGIIVVPTLINFFKELGKYNSEKVRLKEKKEKMISNSFI